MSHYNNNLPNLMQLLKNNIETIQENLKIMENICDRIENLPTIKQILDSEKKEF